jgi:S-layer family protein
MKKVLSLVLVLAMVLSSMSFAFAGTFEDVADTDYSKAVDTLTALGVVTGYEDGTYRPDKTITRAEMAKLMVVTLGYGDLVAGSKSNFTDTQGHWADPYVALAAGKGMVVGTGNGKFDPDRTVTYDEVYTMLVRGLGYTDTCNELKGMTWPTNFKVKAAELGITDGVEMATTGADRGGVAQAIFNALEATLVSVDSDGNVVNIVDKNKNGLELLSRIADIDEDYVVSSELFDPTNKNYAGDMVDLAPYIYQSLKVYLNDDDEVVYIKDTNSLVIEGEVDEVTLSKSGKVATVAVETADGSIKKLDFTVDEADGLLAEIPGSIFENRASKSEATFKYLEDTESIKIVANEGTKSNGKIEEDEVDGFVLETQTKVARVEEVYGKGDDKVDVFTLPTNSKDEPDFNKIIVKGDADSLEDIKVDDVIVEYLAEDDEFTTLVVSRDTVEGEITRIGGTDVYVDGTKYKLNTTAGHEDSLLLGDEGIFFLDHNGKIVAFDGEGAGATDYAVVLDVAPGEISGRFDNSLDEYPQLKVITQAGDEVVYDVYVKLNSDGNKVSDSAKYTGTDGKTSDLFVDTDIKSNAISSTKLEGLDVSGSDNTVIKMKLNSDKKITKIEVVEDKSIDLDTTKSSFKLATNALIFSIADQDSVSESKLNSTVVGTAVYNKNGQIEVLLTNSVDDANYTFAYITKIQGAKQNGDEVQALTAYVNGEKVDPLYTDDDDIVTDAKYNVYALDLGSDNIATEAKLASKVTTSQGLTAYIGKNATGVSSSNGTIQLSGAGWLNLAEDATIVGVDEDGDVKAIRKLSSIVKNESVIDVYYYDSEVVLIVIHEDYEKETTPPVVENSKVTFVNEDEGLIEVDNKVLKLDSNVRLVSADGKDTLAIGPKSVASKLTKGDELAKVTQKDGAVVEIQLAK